MGDSEEEQIAELQGKVKTFEKSLKAQTEKDEDEKKKEVKEARKAAILQAVSFMGDEQYGKYKEAISASDNADLKAAMEEIDKEREKAAKSKKGKVEDDKNTVRITSLEAKLVEPIIKEMLKAREDNGATKEELAAFEKSLKGKSLEEIEERYNNEKILLKSVSATEDPKVHFDWNAGNPAQLAAKSLEEIFEETP